MAGVFISYSHADQAVAERIMLALKAIGADVWWDSDVTSADRLEALKRQAGELAAVAALWTPNSINSDVVWDEAGVAQKHSRLINLLLGADEPPFMFGAGDRVELNGWTGRSVHAGWRGLVETLDAATGAGGALITALDTETATREKQEAALAAATTDDDGGVHHAVLKAAFDDWLSARGALADEAIADIHERTTAPAEPVRPLSLFIPADKLPFGGLEAAEAPTAPALPLPPPAPPPVAAPSATLDALTAAVERALAAGPDGRRLAHVLRSPLRPPLVEPAPPPPATAPAAAAAAIMADGADARWAASPPPASPGPKNGGGSALLWPLLLIGLAIIVAAIWFLSPN